MPLAVGSNTINVVVTSQDGTTTKTYFISVNREKPIVERSINPLTVAPGGTVAVTLTIGPGTANSGTRETLPSGFSWIRPASIPFNVTPSLPLPGNTQLLEILALGEVVSYTYELTAAATPGIYTITGTLRDFSRVDHPLVGDSQITIAGPPGVTVSPTDLTIDEGGSGTYTVELNTQPTATVTVTIVDPTDNADVTANPANLRFTTSNWSTAKTVTVSAAEDDDPTEDTATVTHTVAGGDYASFAASSVAVTVTDNDTPGVTVAPTSLTVNEGATATYTVRLNTQPSGDVTVAISSDNTDVTVSTPSLTFTSTTWNATQTITVTAAQDANAAVDMATLTHNPSGADYNSNSVSNATVTDDETAGVTVTPTFLMLTEGGSDTYSVVLDTEPTATVTFTVADDSAEVNVLTSSLTFTTSDWNMAKTVTVASIADDVDEGTETATATHMVSGGDYGSVSAADVDVTVTDDDTRGVTVSESLLTIEEADRSTYTVVLTSAPTANVTVEVSSDTTGVTVSPSSLTFMSSNWNSARTVTVRTAEDRIDEADQTAALTHMVSGGDYGSVSATGVTVTVTDDDTRGLTLSATSLTIAEGGQGDIHGEAGQPADS